MRAPAAVVLVPVVALLATVWLPFVNRATLWLGLPSVMVWTVVWVLVLTPYVEPGLSRGKLGLQ